MTEQEKREKVVALLERYMATPNLAGVENYGAEIADMPAQLITDVIALLKAQEPRVMTPTEAYTADFVYVEFDGVITPALRTSNEREGHRESYFATQQLGGEWMRWDDYGITWRCWTSRPTDAQREATPWGSAK